MSHTFDKKAAPFGNPCADLSDIFGNDSAGVGLIEAILLAQQIDQYAIVFLQKRHEDHGSIPFFVDESAELRNNKTFTASEITRNNLVYHKLLNKVNAVSKITFFAQSYKKREKIPRSKPFQKIFSQKIDKERKLPVLLLFLC